MNEQELFERVRKHAAEIMALILDEKFDRAKRLAKIWMDLYQCADKEGAGEVEEAKG